MPSIYFKFNVNLNMSLKTSLNHFLEKGGYIKTVKF